MVKKSALLIALVLVVVIFGWYRYERLSEPLDRTALIMGTLVEIKIYDHDQSKANQAINAAFAEMSRIEQLMSRHVDDSDVSRLSHADAPLAVSQETADLIRLGQQIAHLSHGAFDLTLGRLKELWGINTDHPYVPTDAERRQAVTGIGPDALQVDGRVVSKSTPALQLDLGGIAKGYAVDRVVALLRQAGITSAAVNAGGDISLIGDHQGQPWRIGIQHPRKQGEVLVTLPLANCAVVTSGDYERFFDRDGLRYHHIFDPATGAPARRCQSVTVIAADAATADALATAAFVLGPEQGLKMLEDKNGVEGLIVALDGSLIKTSGLP